MNPIFTDHAEADIEETIAGRPDGYVVPKPNRAEDIRRVVAIIERLEERHHLPFGSTRLLPIATETPEGLLNIREIAGASPRIAAISWGIEDLSAAMGLPRTRDAEGRYLDIPRYARVMCAVAASAAGVEAIDTVYTDIADLERPAARVPGGRRHGLHRQDLDPPGPDRGHQPGVHAVPGGRPTRRWPSSRRSRSMRARGAGAFAWKGQMMDMPHLTRAKKIADRARQAGVI